MKKALQELTRLLKEAKEFITALINTTWNGFYINIWNKRCETVVSWEKTTGISKAEKMRKETKTKEKGKAKMTQREERHTDEEGKTQAAKEKIEIGNKIQETWLGSVYNYIDRKMRLFFYGLNG